MQRISSQVPFFSRPSRNISNKIAHHTFFRSCITEPVDALCLASYLCLQLQRRDFLVPSSQVPNVNCLFVMSCCITIMAISLLCRAFSINMIIATPDAVLLCVRLRGKLFLFVGRFCILCTFGFIRLTYRANVYRFITSKVLCCCV